jgi:hypothetical protein
MELEIVEVGPSSRPLRYVPRQLEPWHAPPPPPPPPPPTPHHHQQHGGAGDAAGAPAAQQFDSEKLPQTVVSEIRPFLRAANQVEAENPRVAYLCECPPARAIDRALPAPRTLFPLTFLAVESFGARQLFVEMRGEGS